MPRKTTNPPAERNPEKAAARISVNGVMLGSIFVTLAVIFSEPDRFPITAIAQIVWAIPFLFVSSLAYSKLGYRSDVRPWNDLAYFTGTTGNFLMINAVGIMVGTISPSSAFLYFLIVVLLMSAYSIVNIRQRKDWYWSVLKFAFSMLILLVGGVRLLQ